MPQRSRCPAFIPTAYDHHQAFTSFETQKRVHPGKSHYTRQEMPSLPGRPASQRDSITWHPGQANHQGGLSGRNHDCGYNCADQCLVLPGVPPGMETPRCAEYAEYDGWMSQFCLQPLADPRNGALAFFFPCVLYGKTKWRIEKLKAEFEREQGPPGSRGVVEGRQPGEAHAWEDSMFKCEDGCNDNCLSCFLSCLCTCGVCYCKSNVFYLHHLELMR